jgi:hypothetical protein
MVPDPAAEGPLTTIKTDATGKVKKYQEWNLPTDPRDKRDFEPGKRFDKNGPAHTNPDGTTVPTPHIHDPDGTARPAEPHETPQ